MIISSLERRACYQRKLGLEPHRMSLWPSGRSQVRVPPLDPGHALPVGVLPSSLPFGRRGEVDGHQRPWKANGPWLGEHQGPKGVSSFFTHAQWTFSSLALSTFFYLDLCYGFNQSIKVLLTCWSLSSIE
jgi:hypothetical protein